MFRQITSAGRSKSTGAPRCFVKISSPYGFGRDDLFDDQLADLASCSELYSFVTRVIEQTTDLAPVIRIDYTGKHIESILRRQSGSRCNSSIKPWRNRN